MTNNICPETIDDIDTDDILSTTVLSELYSKEKYKHVNEHSYKLNILIIKSS